MIKVFFKRLMLLIKLSNICKKKGFKFITNGFFWWLGWNKGKNCNFHIVTGDSVYSVKLIGSRSRRIYYNFIDENTYSTKDLRFQLKMVGVEADFKGKKKKPYNFTLGLENLQNEDKNKKLTNIILMNPVAHHVTYSRSIDNETLDVYNGEKVPEGVFYTSTGFLTMLKREDALK